MKVISIKQPWATLIAIGEKQFETRSWATKYRGELAIHASKKIDKGAIYNTLPIIQALSEHGIDKFDQLPTGVIIAKCNLVDCLKSLDTWTDGYILEKHTFIYSPEYEFGDYTPGRYAWKLTEVKQIEPIPAKGQLGLWNYNL
ncbi:MAG: hypothetical protein JWM44_4204 [Bacilli bacterium]|nr:hypothetical protein [Bacilli bacterium]